MCFSFSCEYKVIVVQCDRIIFIREFRVSLSVRVKEKNIVADNKECCNSIRPFL